MFHRRSRIVLAAGITVALITAMAGPGSARALAGGQTSTSLPVPVNVTGDIRWTMDNNYFLNDIPPQTGVDQETGTVHIALTDVTDGGAAVGGNSSTYSIAYNQDLMQTFPDGCTYGQTGSFSGSGPLVYNNSNFGITIQPGSDVSVLVSIPYAVTFTQTAGPSCNNPGTITYTSPQYGSPLCPTGPGEASYPSGTLQGTFVNGTVNLDCSGTDVTTGIVFSVTGMLTVSQDCVSPYQFSGPAWVQQFPDSGLISDLAYGFQQDVINFTNAMQQAEITVIVNSTLRPRQRAYLMHYSWMIWQRLIAPEDVPQFIPVTGELPVNICWVHVDSTGAEDRQASVAAARQMVEDYDITELSDAPALDSRHTEGLAIDMTTIWGLHTIKIVEGTMNGGSGQVVTINTGPHSGLNTQLMAVGLTYGVHHFCYPPGTCQMSVPANDRSHWSVDGH